MVSDFLPFYARFDGVDDVADVVVSYPGAGGEADADLEEALADAVDIGGRVAVDGLAVHGLPQGAALNVGAVEANAQGLHVVVGLAVGGGRRGLVDDTGGASDGALDHGAVGLVLTLYPQRGVERGCAEPEVGVVLRPGVAVHGDAVDFPEELAVELLDMAVVGDVGVEHGHLAAADARADVAHAVVVAYGLVLVVGVRLAGLGGVPHHPLAVGGVAADQGAAARGGDHLVAVERQHPELSERAQLLPVETRAEALGGVLDHRDAVAPGHLHDAADVVGHAVKGHRDDGLGLAAGLRQAVPDGPLEQLRVHVPARRLGVDEHRRGAAVRHRVGRGAEGERLHDDLVAGDYAARHQGQVDGGGAGRQGNDPAVERGAPLAAIDKFLKVLLESVDVRTQRHDPVLGERLLDELHLIARHMRQAQYYPVSHIFSCVLCCLLVLRYHSSAASHGSFQRTTRHGLP